MTGCRYGQKELLEDLTAYKTVDIWLQCIVGGHSEFRPNLCVVMVNGEVEWLIRDGKVTKKAISHIKRISELAYDLREIPNDNLYINVDRFQKELFVKIK